MRKTSEIIDSKGHATRFSDSSFYDEVCVLCGGTDGRGDNGLRGRCTKGVPEGATDHWMNVSYGFPEFVVERNFAVEEPTYRHRKFVWPIPDPAPDWIPGDSPDGKHHF